MLASTTDSDIESLIDYGYELLANVALMRESGIQLDPNITPRHKQQR